MLWTLENPTRFLQERLALERLALEVKWLQTLKWTLTQKGLLQVNAEINVAGEIFQVELIYPNLFPETPAFVRPGNGITPRWSNHQYGPGGVLCLEWGPDTWRPEISGADLLRSTYKLLSTERPAGGDSIKVPSRHYVTLGQEVRQNPRRLLFNTPVAELVGKLEDQSYLKLITKRIFHDSNTVFFISEMTQKDSPPQKNHELPASFWELMHLFLLDSPGWLFKSKSIPPGPFTNSKQLLDAIQAAGFSDFTFPENDGKITLDHLVLIVGADNKVRAFTVAIYGDGSVKDCFVIDSTKADGMQRLPPRNPNLSTKRVGIVGLGSVGSKVAVSLARSGIRRFLLVDDDILLPGNLCRNELTWTHVGMNKAEAVRETLLLIAPDIDVQCRQARIAGQESAESASTAVDALAACDILIDATASPSVFLLLAAITKKRSLPIVWGEIFAGGIGAMVARSRPGKDPDASTTRAGLYHALEALPKAPFIHEAEYDVATEKEPLTAFDSEVAQLAAVITRFVVDALLAPTTSEFPYSVYLLGFKKAWIFTAPFDARPLILDTPAPTPTVPQNEAERAAVKSIISELAKEQSGNDINHST